MTHALFSLDFDELEGGLQATSRGRTVTEADIVSFAGLTGDHHPQHLDAEWSARSRFGRRIAHGMLILSYAAGLLDFDPHRIVALRRLRDVVFKRPVAIGDTIRVVARIDQIRPLDAQTGQATCEWRVQNQHGALVARATVDVLWRRGPLEDAKPALNGNAAALASPVAAPPSGLAPAPMALAALDLPAGVVPL